MRLLPASGTWMSIGLESESGLECTPEGGQIGNDQKRPRDLARTMLDGEPLLRVELGEIGRLEG